MNVFNAAGTAYLGPQPFAFDRTAMLTGATATFISPVGPLGGYPRAFPASRPRRLRLCRPPAHRIPFVEFPDAGDYTTYHFHVDFATPANSTFTTFATPAGGGLHFAFVRHAACVPQLGVTAANKLDGIGDRLMFRLAYRNFGDHESVVGSFTVKSSGVGAIRWFELRDVTAGPVTVFQESTYQPDTTWRWLSSAAMDGQGNLAIGFSASDSTINPQIRYAGRLATDPVNTLAQGETHLFDGAGSQKGSGNRWGDYSALTVDPAGRHHFLVYERILFDHDELRSLAHPDRKFQADDRIPRRRRRSNAQLLPRRLRPNCNTNTNVDPDSHANANTYPYSHTDAPRLRHQRPANANRDTYLRPQLPLQPTPTPTPTRRPREYFDARARRDRRLM